MNRSDPHNSISAHDGRRSGDGQHWRDAAILAALSGTQPIWELILGNACDMVRVRDIARTSIAPTNGMSLHGFASMLLQGGQAGFHNFVRDWMDADAQHGVDDVLILMFSVVPRDEHIGRFFAEALACENVTATLATYADASIDGDILDHVDQFEVQIISNDHDEWERKMLATLPMDPFVDLTYPIYRAYLRRAQFNAASRLFKEKLKSPEMPALISRFEAEFGNAVRRSAWESLLA